MKKVSGSQEHVLWGCFWVSFGSKFKPPQTSFVFLLCFHTKFGTNDVWVVKADMVSALTQISLKYIYWNLVGFACLLSFCRFFFKTGLWPVQIKGQEIRDWACLCFPGLAECLAHIKGSINILKLNWSSKFITDEDEWISHCLTGVQVTFSKPLMEVQPLCTAH